MDGQLRAGTIRTVKEVWWDVRPHPDFGTVEVRIADAVPTAPAKASAAADENRNAFMFVPPFHTQATTYSIVRLCLGELRGIFVNLS